MITETLKQMPISLKRQELRFVVPDGNYQRVVEILGKNFVPTSFDLGVNRTIYYNNSLHEVPWDCTLRSRKYIGENGADSYQLNPQEDYFAEMKLTDGLKQRKDRGRMQLSKTAAHLSEVADLSLNENIRPFFMVDYDRVHFEPKDKGENGLRVTLDRNPAYYSVDENLQAQKAGVENVARIEIKLEEGGDPSGVEKLLGDLTGLDMFPVISKKMAAYNYEKIILRSNGEKPLIKDIPNLEIESKLTVVDQTPYIFFNDLVWHYKRATDGFVVDPTFPYVYETETINYYYRSPSDTRTEGVKLLALPTSAKVIAKANSEIVKDPYSLNCILRRDEIKGDMVPLSNKSIGQVLSRGDNLKLLGSLDRTRKVIYLMSTTDRIYHVSLDRCIDRNDRSRSFSQVEIEYSGVLGGDVKNGRGSEKVAIEEISALTNEIVVRYGASVVPKPLRKIDWILGKS